MSDDIVDRLQFWKHNSEAYAPHPTWRFHTDLDEACAEIERLRKEVIDCLRKEAVAYDGFTGIRYEQAPYVPEDES